MRNAAMRGLLGLCTICTLSVFSGCSQPIGPVAGEELDGTPSEWPQDWAFTADIENVLIETRPEDPYSVTVWGTAVGEHLYVGASTRQATWAKNILENSAVVLSVNGQLYTASATTVTDAQEIEAVLMAIRTKYDVDSDDILEDDSILFRLTKR